MNIVVTGASSGIGYATVLEMVRQKVTRIYALGRNAVKLQQLQNACAAIGDTEVILVECDLTQINFEDLRSVFGENCIDVLINNAGALVYAPFENISPTDLDLIYKTNVYAPFLLTQLLLPNLKKSKIAHVVNIGSMGGVQGSLKFSGLSVYSSSKAAIAGLSECLAQELKTQGIKVNCLALGAVNTEMLASAFPGYKSEMEPQMMAEYIVDFALKQHKFINGKIVAVSATTP